MYLSSFPGSDHQKWAKRSQSKEGQEALAHLRQGDYALYLSINPSDNSILYEAYSASLPLLGVRVYVDKTIESPYQDHMGLDDEDYALLCYIDEKEASESEEVLRKRYGASYDTLSRIVSFSPAQRKQYLEGKSDLSELVEQLRSSSSRLETSWVKPRLSFEFRFQEGVSILPVVLGEGRHRLRSIPSFLAQVKQASAIHDGRGSYLHLGLDSFSPEDQRIIYQLSNDASSDPYYWHESEETAASLLLLCAGKEVLVNEQPLKVDDKPTEAEVQINDYGTISLQGVEQSDRAFFHRDGAALILPKSKRVALYHFQSPASAALCRFVLDHPHFPYSALQEEIGADLLPLLKQKDANVSPAFEEKSRSVRTCIAYYFDYEEEGKNGYPTLTMKTEFRSRGASITRSEYLSSPGQTYEPFLAALAHFGLSESGTIVGDEEIGSVLDQDLNPLSDHCALYLSENIRGNLVRHSKSAIRLRTQSGVDWFSLSFESDSLTPEEINFLLQAYRKKKKYVRINGNYFATDDEDLSRAVREFSTDEDEDLTTQKLPLYQALNLRLEGGLKVEIDDQLQSLFDSLLHFQNTEIHLSDHFSSVLRPYQKDGVKWLYTLAKNSLGGILADDMGLGKTLEMISFLSLLKEDRPTLIVAPKSLLYNWKSEFKKWDPERDVFVVEGTKTLRKKTIESMKDPKNGVYVVSYDSLRNDESLYEGAEFSTVVLDEAQSIANATARKTKAVKTLKAHHRFALTGTPIQNSYMDLWSIFDFLLPGYLDGFKQFQMLYGSLSEAKEAEIHRLEAQVAPFLLRRTKEEVLSDLPPKTEEVLIVSMEEAEEKLYAAYAQNAKLTLSQQKENKRDRVAILAALTRLRQLCVDPSSFLSNFHATSAKLSQTLSMVQEAISGGHKVLIFSSFVTVLHHLQSLLAEQKIESGLISGDVAAKDRLDMAEHFNSEKGESVMLVSLKAGGTGLNLVGADIVIHLDPWWNIAAENQASDRAHRIGQTRPVTVWKLVAKNTIEEKIIELQSLKRSLSSIIRVADEEGSSLTQDDIDFLLS